MLFHPDHECGRPADRSFRAEAQIWSKPMKRLWHEFIKGIFSENPIFFIVLGLCPTLAVSTSVNNAIGMGLAATFVLVFSNAIISAIRRFIPDKIRIPCYIVVIAASSLSSRWS
jgi:electron transport complex protein RnfE